MPPLPDSAIQPVTDEPTPSSADGLVISVFCPPPPEQEEKNMAAAKINSRFLMSVKICYYRFIKNVKGR